MSAPERGLEAVVDAIEGQLHAGAEPDRDELARRFDADPAAVAHCARGLRALHFALGEDDADEPGQPTGLPADYEIRGELGRGGMGVVYRAYQQSLQREVALKVLRPGELMFGAALQRFRREAVSLARLRHPHIVSVHEVGEADGHVYFTMDLVEGRTLSDHVGRRGMPITQAVRLLRQVCEAMAYAHGQGVVHRDLKPANILVAEREAGALDAFVVDFGLARDISAAAAYTVSGQLLGTPGYMSPEQALGESDRVGERSDVYALGVILYECLCGKAPFADLPLVHMLHAVVETEPRPLHEANKNVPRELAAICHKAMAKKPVDRFVTVQALAEDLARFAAGEPTRTQPPSTGKRIVRQLRRILTIPVTVLLVIGGPAYLVMWKMEDRLEGSVTHQQLTYDAHRKFVGGDYDGAVALYHPAIYRAQNAPSITVAVEYAAAVCDQVARWTLTENLTPEYRRWLVATADDLLDPWLPPTRGRIEVPSIGADPSWTDRAHVVRLRLQSWAADELPTIPEQQSTAWLWPNREFARRSSLALFVREPSLRKVVQRERGLSHELVLDALSNYDRLPECARRDFEQWVGASEHPPLVTTTRRSYEQKLCEHVRGDSISVTKLAGTLLDQCSDVVMVAIPVGARSVAAERQQYEHFADLWQRLDAMSLFDRRREAVRHAAHQLSRNGLAGSTTRRNRAFEFIWAATGKQPGPELDEWLQQNGERDPKAWLFDALEAGDAPHMLVAEQVLQWWDRHERNLRRDGKRDAAAAHFASLMSLLLLPDVERPISTYPGSDIEHWRETVR